MAETTEVVDLNLDDKELFQSSMAEPTQETVEVKPETDERPRDEQTGRFIKAEETEAAKAEEAKPEVKAEPEKTTDDQGGQVPSWRLREIREAREASDKRAEESERRAWQFQQELQTIRNQLAEQNKPKAEPVNWFENPDGALKQQISPIEAQLAEMRNEMRLNTSRAMAIATHGAQAVSDMEAAVEKAMQSNHPEIGLLRTQMLQSSDPVGVAINWHKRSKVMELTGGDPEKYKAQVRAELLKDPEFRKQFVQDLRTEASAPPVQLPPSLSRTTGSGASEVSGDDDMSDRALFKDAVNAPRRGARK